MWKDGMLKVYRIRKLSPALFSAHCASGNNCIISISLYYHHASSYLHQSTPNNSFKSFYLYSILFIFFPICETYANINKKKFIKNRKPHLLIKNSRKLNMYY